MPNPLDQLLGNEFKRRVTPTSTAHHLRHLLQGDPDVLSIGAQYVAGSISDSAIEQFIDGVVRRLRPGSRLSNQLALAALAVVLEGKRNEFSRRVLTTMSQIKLNEIADAVGVAKECLAAARSEPALKVRDVYAQQSPPSFSWRDYTDNGVFGSRDGRFVEATFHMNPA
jgi:hypothetical protein